MLEIKITTINFDMDGTIANLYANPQWLPMLRAYDPTPYETAEVLVNMSRLARYIHKAQQMGIQVNIISWLSKESNTDYDQAVTSAKMEWLRRHLPSVDFDAVHIVPYGVPKETLADPTCGILFDDEQRNRENWGETAYEPNVIFDVLKDLLTTL